MNPDDVRETKQFLIGRLNADIRRARAEAEIADWLKRHPAGTDRLVKDLAKPRFTGIEEV